MAEPHVHPIRVYYEDTDAGGVVFYANYLRFAERARTEMMRGAGFESSRLQAEHGIALAVRSCTALFLKPAVLDDWLEIHTRIMEVGGASLRAEQIVRRGDEDLVRMEIHLACMRLTGGPGRLPADLRARFKDISE
ncbi:MAG: tol-pal system-associated acyl-CoA thioesterase [Magnetospirillum sp. WYHS-4]